MCDGRCLPESKAKRNLCVDAGAGLNTASLMSTEVGTAAMLKEIFMFCVFLCVFAF